MEQDPGLPTHTVYRPEDLSKLKGQKLPILAWGMARVPMPEIPSRISGRKSHRTVFLAIAIGPVSDATPKLPARSAGPSLRTTATTALLRQDRTPPELP